MPAVGAGSSTVRSKPEFPRAISTDETAIAVAIPNADVERSRIFRLTEPLMADLRSREARCQNSSGFSTKPLRQLLFHSLASFWQKAQNGCTASDGHHLSCASSRVRSDHTSRAARTKASTFLIPVSHPAPRPKLRNAIGASGRCHARFIVNNRKNTGRHERSARNPRTCEINNRGANRGDQSNNRGKNRV